VDTPASPRRPLWVRAFMRCALAVLALGAGLIAAEVAVRMLSPVPIEAEMIGREMRFFRGGGDKFTRAYTVDAELGFLPVIGGGLYNDFATWRNRYPREKRPGVTRLLFIGDSVTAR